VQTCALPIYKASTPASIASAMALCDRRRRGLMRANALRRVNHQAPMAAAVMRPAHQSGAFSQPATSASARKARSTPAVRMLGFLVISIATDATQEVFGVLNGFFLLVTNAPNVVVGSLDVLIYAIDIFVGLPSKA